MENKSNETVTPNAPKVEPVGTTALENAKNQAKDAINNTKGGGAPRMEGEFQGELTMEGTINQFRTKKGWNVSKTVQASKVSGYPTLYFRDQDNKVHGVVLSQKAGALYPVDAVITEQQRDNLYVQSRVMEATGEVGYIITTGGTIEWE